MTRPNEPKTVVDIRIEAMRKFAIAYMIENLETSLIAIERMPNDELCERLQSSYCPSDWSIQEEFRARVNEELIEILRTL